MCARGRRGLVCERGTSKVCTWIRQCIRMTKRDSYRTWLHDMVYYCASPCERRQKGVVCRTRLDGGGVADVHQEKLESVKNDLILRGLLVGIKAGRAKQQSLAKKCECEPNKHNTPCLSARDGDSLLNAQPVLSLSISIFICYMLFFRENKSIIFKHEGEESEWTCFSHNWRKN